MTPTTILVVDDEPVILELVREVMDDYVVITAATATEARAIVMRGDSFDVALVDKNLPDGSGLEVVKWLREQRPECEALVMTGYPSMDSAVEAIAAGATDYLIKPMRDIVEMRLRVNNAVDRVQQKRALKESDERYLELFQATPDAVIVFDAETRVVLEANAAAETLYRRQYSELLGRTPSDLTAAEPPPIMRDGMIIRRDMRPDGTVVSVEVTATTARRGGRPIVVEVVRDVSERERAAAERTELEQRLIRAGRLEALGKLAAGIAHDFNNLLCVIGVGSDLAASALDSHDVADAKQELEQIAATVQSAASLTRQLLAFSGRQLARSQVIDLNSQIEASARMLERALGARVKLGLELTSVPVSVQIDPGQLEQVITNLAVNARDAMPAGGTVRIATRAESSKLGVGGVALEVSDRGTGIPPDILANIFEPFFTTKGTDKGTGLGLATVREIVIRAGGQIDVISKLGEGTTFRIWLPASDGVAHETIRLASFVPAGRGESVMIVEDDPRVREVTRRVLVAGGYAVHEARDGEEALAHIAGGGRADVLVADLDLPGITGVECARKISEHDPKVKVLYTSGMTSDPRGNRDAVHGATFLSKPYTNDQLMRSVRKTLDTKR